MAHNILSVENALKNENFSILNSVVKNGKVSDFRTGIVVKIF